MLRKYQSANEVTITGEAYLAVILNNRSDVIYLAWSEIQLNRLNELITSSQNGDPVVWTIRPVIDNYSCTWTLQFHCCVL